MRPGPKAALLLTGGTLALTLAAVVLYEASGTGASARALPAELAHAGQAGLEPDPNLLVRQEAKHPNRPARLIYDRALQAFYDKHKGGDFIPSAGERRVMRPDILALVPLSRAAAGATSKDWRCGIWVRFPEGATYRRAVRSLAFDADAHRRAGDLSAAVADLEAADALCDGLSADASVIPNLVLISGARLLSRPMIALLTDPRLTRPETERVLALTDGPTFRPFDDRLSLSHDLAMALATISGTARAEPRQAIMPALDPVDRLAPLGRIPVIRRAWATPIVRAYADAAEQLPYRLDDPRTDFEAYHAAYIRLEADGAATEGFPEEFARALLVSGDADSDVALTREAERRVLAHAARLRLGENPKSPRDPFSPAPLRVVRTPKGTLVYSLYRDRKDDDGIPWSPKTKKGDFAVLIPPSP